MTKRKKTKKTWKIRFSEVGICEEKVEKGRKSPAVSIMKSRAIFLSQGEGVSIDHRLHDSETITVV